MKHTDFSIVFFGTGPVAAKSLQNLVKIFKVELVVTKPKPKHHRDDWPVADLAEKLDLPVNYAGSKLEVEEGIKSNKLKSDVGLVIDFGLIMSAKTIEAFPYGIINSHFSLLPRWRGADPITFAILHGDRQTGVSLMKIVPKMDEGQLLAQKKIDLHSKINSSQLTEKLIKLSNAMIVENLPKYLNGELSLQNQAASGVTYSRKIQKQDGIIDWSKSADEIEREIRAFYQWPRSRTTLNHIEVIITEAAVVDEAGQTGDFAIKNNNLIIFCTQKSLSITRLQPAGKKEMEIGEFIRGSGPKLGLG